MCHLPAPKVSQHLVTRCDNDNYIAWHGYAICVPVLNVLKGIRIRTIVYLSNMCCDDSSVCVCCLFTHHTLT